MKLYEVIAEDNKMMKIRQFENLKEVKKFIRTLPKKLKQLSVRRMIFAKTSKGFNGPFFVLTNEKDITNEFIDYETHEICLK